jgi:hypothetical protein
MKQTGPFSSDLVKKARDFGKSNGECKRENADIRKASLRFSEENRSLNEELARLHGQQDAIRTDLTRFTEELAKVWQELASAGEKQKKSDEASKRVMQMVVELGEANKAQIWKMDEIREANSRQAEKLSRLEVENASLVQANVVQEEEIAALRKQQEKFRQEIGSLKLEFAQERANKFFGQFPFTSDPPERGKMPPGGIISYLTAKCDGNIHDRGVVEITASSVFWTDYPRNTADLGTDSYFKSEDEPRQWICFDFKSLRIEPTHYTIRTFLFDCLKSWTLEGSDDGVSWTEIDRRENNSDLDDTFAVKTFAVSRSGSFERIRLRQIGPNHGDDIEMRLSAFEVFGAIARLPGCPVARLPGCPVARLPGCPVARLPGCPVAR